MATILRVMGFFAVLVFIYQIRSYSEIRGSIQAAQERHLASVQPRECAAAQSHLRLSPSPSRCVPCACAQKARGFWDGHVYPQYVSLISPTTGRALHLDYVGRSELASHEVTALVQQHLSPPPAASGAARPRAGCPPPPRTNANPGAAAESVWPTLNETREICELYSLDYALLSLPRPRVCLQG